MVKTQDIVAPELTRERICQYVWDRYIDQKKPAFELDEQQAVKFFEKLYANHPLNEDQDCYFYGILLYELAFIDAQNRDRYLVKAKEVLEVYRNITGETEWDVTEDRYADVCDIIESENLLEKVKTRAQLAPEIPGMVLVPGGPFPFGPDRQEIHLEPYYIDVTPVTNRQYREFLEETQYRPPVVWETKPDAAHDELPVTGVSWMDALYYCKWAGKSLPTVQQWEKAARGTEGFTYPWGNEPLSPEKANYRHDDFAPPRLEPISKYDAYASPYGCKVMVGSVWEWTNTIYPDAEGCCYIKGGSYVDPGDPEFVSATAALWADKKAKTDILGFRCTKMLEGV